MSVKARPLQTAEISGPRRAHLISGPGVAASLIKKAERPLLVVGSNASNLGTREGDLIDTAIEMSRRMTVVATGHMVGEFLRRGAKVHSMSMMSLGDVLRDPEWKGLDNEGGYDLVIFVGTIYYMGWLVLSGLKNFAQSLTTLSLEPGYQPNATWSLGTTTNVEWRNTLEELLKQLEVDA